MNTFYTFPVNETGRAARALLAEHLRAAGRTVREFEETVTAGRLTFVLLKLEAGTRPDEGKIAADVKRQKARKT